MQGMMVETSRLPRLPAQRVNRLPPFAGFCRYAKPPTRDAHDPSLILLTRGLEVTWTAGCGTRPMLPIRLPTWVVLLALLARFPTWTWLVSRLFLSVHKAVLEFWTRRARVPSPAPTRLRLPTCFKHEYIDARVARSCRQGLFSLIDDRVDLGRRSLLPGERAHPSSACRVGSCMRLPLDWKRVRPSSMIVIAAAMQIAMQIAMQTHGTTGQDTARSSDAARFPVARVPARHRQSPPAKDALRRVGFEHCTTSTDLHVTRGLQALSWLKKSRDLPRRGAAPSLFLSHRDRADVAAMVHRDRVRKMARVCIDIAFDIACPSTIYAAVLLVAVGMFGTQCATSLPHASEFCTSDPSNFADCGGVSFSVKYSPHNAP